MLGGVSHGGQEGDLGVGVSEMVPLPRTASPPARPRTSDLRGSWVEGVLGSRVRQTQSPSLSSKCPLHPASRPTCGVFLGASRSVPREALVPVLPVLTARPAAAALHPIGEQRADAGPVWPGGPTLPPVF